MFALKIPCWIPLTVGSSLNVFLVWHLGIFPFCVQSVFLVLPYILWTAHGSPHFQWAVRHGCFFSYCSFCLDALSLLSTLWNPLILQCLHQMSPFISVQSALNPTSSLTPLWSFPWLFHISIALYISCYYIHLLLCIIIVVVPSIFPNKANWFQRLSHIFCIPSPRHNSWYIVGFPHKNTML